MKRRYAVLRVVSFLFKLGAVLVLLIALGSLGFGISRLIAAAGGKGGMMQWAQVGGALFLTVWGIGEFMVLYAMGEALNVLIAVEENTRATSMRLVRLLSLLSEQATTEEGSAEEITVGEPPTA